MIHLASDRADRPGVKSCLPAQASSLCETLPDSGCRVELDWDRAGLRLQVFKVDTKAELEIFDVVGDLDGQLVVGLDARMKLLERPGNRHSVHPLVMLVGPQDSKAQREIVIPED